MFLPINENSRIIYTSKINQKASTIYWFILIMIVGVFISLPFIKLNISVKATGIVRPFDEKTELKSSISTVIEKLNFKEGDVVKKGDIIIELRRKNISLKTTMNDFEIKQRNLFIADLQRLTINKSSFDVAVSDLESPLYRQQCSHFVFQISELNAELRKVNKELHIDSLLSVDKVIAPKEMFDKQIELEKLQANISATQEQQIANWQQQLATYQTERNQYENANQQLNEDNNFYAIKAPVNGVLQSFNKFYQGSLVQAGEVLAIISPQAQLIAECYVDTRDVGLLKLQQPIIFQVDAFDYNYFGMLTGKILTIDNDYTLTDSKPVFKVRCILDKQQLKLKNGFAGDLKKGMTVQARFIITRRSLWQLLFDKIDDWVNPNAPLKTS